ncbi:MAG TPA: DUF2110 family protein [Candidatus Bathyarchaeota archaeon]|nr:DUF2110 family protein [Candidatus Bathyarchaeota archaeon]HEW89803.1 DUF2110 family protein [Candidatus Bathyarchaeota archaeon]
MKRLVVLEKVYGPYRPEEFTPAFLSLLLGLAVDVRVIGTAGRGWLVLELSGEDEAVAIKLLEEEVGLAPEELGKLAKFSTVRGRITTLAEGGVLVDVGVLRPVNVDALVGLSRLRAQLADGMGVELQEISSLFCLIENLPLEVKILEEPTGPGPLSAELSEGQVRLFEEWVASGLDRIIVAGASHHVVKRAISATGLYDKVVDFYRLGLLEHCITLKLGVKLGEAIRALRRRLRKAVVCAFRPLEIVKAFPGRYGGLRL